MMHWANDLIGLPYTVGGSNPTVGFNCWSFVRYVQKRFYNLDLPEVPNPEHYRSIVHSFSNHPERMRWTNTDKPKDGDLVLLSRSAFPCHIGVYLNVDGGGVLHCSSGIGVEFAKLSVVPFSGWTIEGFYRFIGGAA